MTFDTVFIECVEGFNGGLVQLFRADVYTSDFGHHIKTVRSRWVATPRLLRYSLRLMARITFPGE